MASLDLICFKTIASCEVIQRGLRTYNFPNIPTCRQSVTKMVKEYANFIRENLKKSIKLRIDEGERFSLSIDEYTSINNSRFMGFNLHFSDKSETCLGIQKIFKSLNSEKVIEIVKKKLSNFGIILNTHIVAVVTDGASIMMKFGRLILPEHFTCQAYAFHLAVCDLLYIKTQPLVSGLQISTESSDSCEFDDESTESRVSNGNPRKILFQELKKIYKTF